MSAAGSPGRSARTRSCPGIARCASTSGRRRSIAWRSPRIVAAVSSWLALDGEVLVVCEVEALSEQSLDEWGDQPEVHQQRDVDVAEAPGVVGWMVR